MKIFEKKRIWIMHCSRSIEASKLYAWCKLSLLQMKFETWITLPVENLAASGGIIHPLLKLQNVHNNRISFRRTGSTDLHMRQIFIHEDFLLLV